MADVFISYSRKDREFIDRLNTALVEQGLDTWIDVEDIDRNADWWRNIQRGIQSTNAFVVVITQNALESPVCQLEIAEARSGGKRLVPVIRSKPDAGIALGRLATTKLDDLQEHILAGRDILLLARDNWREMSRPNWISFENDDTFDDALTELIESIEKDPEYVTQHTRLLNRAREWEAAGRKPASALRGDDLAQAEAWLAASAGKEPRPTPLHTEYILASQRVRADELRQSRNLLQARFGLVLAIVLVALLGFVFLNLRGSEQTGSEARLDAQVATLARQNVLEQSWALIRNSELVRNRDPELALALAVEANSIDNPPLEIQEFLVDVAQYDRVIRQFSNQRTPVTSIAVSPDQQQALVGLDDGVITLWDLADGEPIKMLLGHHDAVTSLAFSANGNTALSGSLDMSVILWDLERGEWVDAIGASAAVQLVSFGRGNVALSQSADETILSWNLVDGHIDSFQAPSGWVESESTSIDFSPDGQRYLVGDCGFSTSERPPVCRGGVVNQWDVRTGEFISSFRGHNDAAISVAYSPDGQYVLSASSDNSIILWNADTEEKLRTFSGHTGAIRDVIFSPNGNEFFSVTGEGTFLWGIDSGRILRIFPEIIDRNRTIFSPDGKVALSGFTDGRLVLWRVDTLDELIRWTYQNRYVRELTCQERLTYRVEPYCDARGVYPTRTPYPTAAPGQG